MWKSDGTVLWRGDQRGKATSEQSPCDAMWGDQGLRDLMAALSVAADWSSRMKNKSLDEVEWIFGRIQLKTMTEEDPEGNNVCVSIMYDVLEIQNRIAGSKIKSFRQK